MEKVTAKEKEQLLRISGALIEKNTFPLGTLKNKLVGTLIQSEEYYELSSFFDRRAYLFIVKTASEVNKMLRFIAEKPIDLSIEDYHKILFSHIENIQKQNQKLYTVLSKIDFFVGSLLTFVMRSDTGRIDIVKLLRDETYFSNNVFVVEMRNQIRDQNQLIKELDSQLKSYLESTVDDFDKAKTTMENIEQTVYKLRT